MMKKRFVLLEKIFLRSVVLPVSGIVLFAAQMIMTVRIISRNQEGSAGLLSILTSSMLLSSIAFAYFLFASYELSSKLERSGGDELSGSVRGEAVHRYFSQFLVLLIPALIWSLAVSACQLAAYRLSGALFPGYLHHALSAVLLYCFLPSIVAILLGMVISAVRKRAFAYLIIIGAVLLASPVPLEYYANRRILKLPAAEILDWFCLSIPNAAWLPDQYYGVSLELTKWLLCLFWIALSCFLLLLQQRRHLFKKQKAGSIIALCLTLLLGARFAARGNDFIMIKDDRSSSVLTADMVYYSGNPAADEIPADFQVEKYTMDLTVHSRLSAKVTMKLQLSGDSDRLYFTLYHGLHVKSVSDGDGKALAFEQNGDCLTVKARVPELTVIYSGNLGIYASNYQSIYLPEYVAYYPLPGRICLYDGEPCPLTLQSKSEYDITLHHPGEAMSNLPSEDKNHFAGSSCGAALYAGLIRKTSIGDVTFIESPLDAHSALFDSAAVEKEWKKYQDFFQLQDDFGLSAKTVVFQPSSVFAVNSKTTTFIATEGSLFYGDILPQPDVLCLKYFLSTIHRSEESRYLYDIFERRMYGGLSSSHTSDAVKPPYEEMTLLLVPDDQLSVEEWFNKATQSEALNDLFAYLEDRLGADVLLPQVYDYLNDPEPEQNWLDFLYEMDGEEV